MTFADDWQFFRQHPERAYRCRLATAVEIEDLRLHGALNGDSQLEAGCSIFALARIDRDKVTIQMLLLVLEDSANEMSEVECAQAWHDADSLLMGSIKRQLQ